MPGVPDRRPGGAKRSQAEEARLPHGATFEVRYDATSETWSGRLTIGEAMFSGQASGVFKLLTQLDDKYRKSLTAKMPEVRRP